MIAIFLLYAVCASTFTICKAALLYTKPIFFVGVRMSVAGILLLGYWVIRYGWPKEVIRHWKQFSAIILFHIYITYLCDLWSLQYLTSGQSSFIYNLSPLLTAFFSYCMFNETMSSKKWLGLAIGFLGLLPELIGFGNSAAQGLPVIPTVVLIAGVASAMYGWTVMRSLIIHQNYSPIIVNGIGMIGGGLLALVTSAYAEGWSPLPVTQVGPFISLTALIILMANIIFYNMYGHLLSQYTATFLAFSGFVTPFFAALFGWLFLGEQISVTFIISLAVVSCGIYLFYQEELRRDPLANESMNSSLEVS